jgi:hypothetical protein
MDPPVATLLSQIRVQSSSWTAIRPREAYARSLKRQVKLEEAAPRNVETVRTLVFEALGPLEIDQLGNISMALLARVDPDSP